MMNDSVIVIHLLFIDGPDAGNRQGNCLLLTGNDNLIFGYAGGRDVNTSTGLLTKLLNESIICTSDEWMKSLLKRQTFHGTLILNQTVRS